VNPTGYWGVPTSTVDWCEANYAHSHYVAEWFNTTTSLAMGGVGLAGILLHRRVLERRFLFAFGLLILVGLGSIAFHGTLEFGLQMLDELPMLYLVTLIVWILLENRPERRHGNWLPAVLIGYCASLTVLYSLSRGKVEFFLYHSTFGSLELFALVSSWWLQRQVDDRAVKRAFRLGIAAYLFAIAIWFVDLKHCSFESVTLPSLGIPNPQLHAWWHVLVSLGFYLLLLVIAAARQRTLGKPYTLELWPIAKIRSP
jgi:dihydroceramidase